MEWCPTGWSVCLPLLIFPCTIKSRSSLLAPSHPSGPGKRAVKQLCVCMDMTTSGPTMLDACMLTMEMFVDFPFLPGVHLYVHGCCCVLFKPGTAWCHFEIISLCFGLECLNSWLLTASSTFGLNFIPFIGRCRDCGTFCDLETFFKWTLTQWQIHGGQRGQSPAPPDVHRPKKTATPAMFLLCFYKIRNFCYICLSKTFLQF